MFNEEKDISRELSDIMDKIVLIESIMSSDVLINNSFFDSDEMKAIKEQISLFSEGVWG